MLKYRFLSPIPRDFVSSGLNTVWISLCLPNFLDDSDAHVNSFLKNTKLGPLWGDFWSYSKYTYAFLSVPYPYPYPNNNQLCPITTVPFYLPRDHAWWKKYLVKDWGVCCSKEPSKLTQSGLLCLSCEAAWCSTEFSKVLWHIDNYHKKKEFCGQISVRIAVENKVNQISLLQGFPEILSWQNLNHFLNFLIIEFLMGLLIHGTHSEKLSELKTRKSGNLSSSPK